MQTDNLKDITQLYIAVEGYDGFDKEAYTQIWRKIKDLPGQEDILSDRFEFTLETRMAMVSGYVGREGKLPNGVVVVVSRDYDGDRIEARNLQGVGEEIAADKGVDFIKKIDGNYYFGRNHLRNCADTKNAIDDITEACTRLEEALASKNPSY